MIIAPFKQSQFILIASYNVLFTSVSGSHTDMLVTDKSTTQRAISSGGKKNYISSDYSYN